VRFLSGFLTASVLWGAAAFLYIQGSLDFLFPEEESAGAEEVTSEPEVDPADSKKKGKRRLKRPRLKRRSGDGSRSAGLSGNSTVGDDIGWNDDRNMDMAAGEAQLSGTQIEDGFDSAMNRIRRCLILVPADGEITGKLVFGMRVGSDGKPRAVNLTGPSIVTAGESGSCLRTAAQSIRFASFNGPDMLFKYPITLQ
jgi:hypothetical protein